MSGFPTHDEIEAMRDGGFVPDLVVDDLHAMRDRHDRAESLLARIAARPAHRGTVTIPVVR